MNEYADLVRNHHFTGGPACMFSPEGPITPSSLPPASEGGLPKLCSLTTDQEMEPDIQKRHL